MSRLGSPKGLFAFFEEDLEEADRALFGRESYPDRRGFLKGAGLATMGAMLGAAMRRGSSKVSN
ncbi:MAG: twin-arginine translocation signal domain-containing protein, partial [Alphaproteobacteria bacterium]